MFYSVASPDWKPGQPLTPAGALLFRSRAEAEAFAPDAAVVGVTVRYDSAARAVVTAGPAAGGGSRWSATAVRNKLGGITVFAAIPAASVQPLTVALGAAPGGFDRGDRPAGDFHGWDSLTMALLA